MTVYTMSYDDSRLLADASCGAALRARGHPPPPQRVASVRLYRVAVFAWMDAADDVLMRGRQREDAAQQVYALGDDLGGVAVVEDAHELKAAYGQWSPMQMTFSAPEYGFALCFHSSSAWTIAST